MSDSKPAFVPRDHSVEQTVEEFTRRLVAAMESQNVTAQEEIEAGNPPSYPHFDADVLKAWLSAHFSVDEETFPLLGRQVAWTIHTKCAGLTTALAELDTEMGILLRGSGSTIATAQCHVNLPPVVEALKDCVGRDDFVAFVPLLDFYVEFPFKGDPRTDVLMGVIKWGDYYICRPALVSMVEIEDLLIETDKKDMTFKKPTAQYTPNYGAH